MDDHLEVPGRRGDPVLDPARAPERRPSSRRADEALAVAVVEVAREASTEATGELVTRAHFAPQTPERKNHAMEADEIEATGVLDIDVSWVNGNYQRILFHSVRTASADAVEDGAVARLFGKLPPERRTPDPRRGG